MVSYSGDPYRNPELFRWTGSMEGIPEWVDPAETSDERLSRAAWQQRAHARFEVLGRILPGLALALAVAGVGKLAAGWVGSSLFGLERSPVPPILVAIVLGLAIRNSIGLPRVYEAGLGLSLRQVLRIGVALLGIRLSLGTVGSLGALAVPIVVVCIATALILVGWVNRKLGLPPRLGTLVAVGTAICGNSAIVATAGAIGAEEDEVSYAVGCISVFGLAALLTYPFLAHWLYAGDPQLVGLFLGTAIHDTAQVVGAGLMYAQQFGAAEVLDSATVTKLVRNLFMLAVIPLMAFRYRRSSGGPTHGAALQQIVPLFVGGFLALAALRTLGDLGELPFGGLLSAQSWGGVITCLSIGSTWCLTVGMASVGLGTSLKRLTALGLKPLAVGLTAASVVGAASAALVHLVGGILEV